MVGTFSQVRAASADASTGIETTVSAGQTGIDGGIRADADHDVDAVADAGPASTDTTEPEFGPGEKGEPMIAATALTREVWADRWTASKQSRRTRETYEHSITAWFGWCDRRGLNVWQVEAHDVDAYRNMLADTGRAARGLRRELATVSSFYKHVLRHGRPAPVERNPAEWVDRPPVPKSSPSVALELDETEAVRAESIRRGPRTAAVVHLLLGTALRVTEACEAKVSALRDPGDGSRILIVVRKGNVESDVVIPPAEWAVVKHYLDTRAEVPDGWLLATAGGRGMSRQTAYRLVQETAWAVTRRTKVGPHDLRHTTATQALDQGESIQEVQHMLGHSSSDTTQLYDKHANQRGKRGGRRVSEAAQERRLAARDGALLASSTGARVGTGSEADLIARSGLGRVTVRKALGK